MKYETVTICHQIKRKTALWECEDYLSSEKICIFLQESLAEGGKLLSEVFYRTPVPKRSKSSPFGTYTGCSLCRGILDLGFITNPKNGRVKALSEACLDRPYMAYQKKSYGTGWKSSRLF